MNLHHNINMHIILLSVSVFFKSDRIFWKDAIPINLTSIPIFSSPGWDDIFTKGTSQCSKTYVFTPSRRRLRKRCFDPVISQLRTDRTHPRQVAPDGSWRLSCSFGRIIFGILFQKSIYDRTNQYTECMICTSISTSSIMICVHNYINHNKMYNTFQYMIKTHSNIVYTYQTIHIVKQHNVERKTYPPYVIIPRNKNTRTKHIPPKPPISLSPHHLAQKVASDPSSSKETWGVEETPPYGGKPGPICIVGGFFDDQMCLFLMIQHHPEKKTCCLEKAFLFFRVLLWGEIAGSLSQRNLSLSEKFHQQKRQNLGCPSAQWDLWRCHPTQFWRKDITASPRIPPKHPKTLPDILSYL